MRNLIIIFIIPFFKEILSIYIEKAKCLIYREDVCLPDFMAIGVMKSGSTSLMKYLAFHPQVNIAKNEMHYFDDKKNPSLEGYMNE